ncbi:hypothetical protein CDAR_593701, partial [Caerostris darwini]
RARLQGVKKSKETVRKKRKLTLWNRWKCSVAEKR